MKVKSKRRLLTSLMVMLLVCVMAIASGCSGIFDLPNFKSNTAQSSSDDSYILNQSVNSVDFTEHLDKSKLLQEDSVSILTDEDDVTLMIKASEQSLYTLYEEYNGNLSYSEFVNTRESCVNSENMQKLHNEIFNKISKKINAEFIGSTTGLVNVFSIRIKYGDRKKAQEIALANGAISVSISESYAAPELSQEDYDIVYNSIEVYDTGIFDTTGVNYKGEGMVVAVLDTGLDYEHKAFSVDNLPKKQDGTIDTERLGMSRQDVAGKIKDLLASKTTSNLTVSDVYLSEKVPFAYDYADCDTEVNTLDSHGTHVAGIIAGQSVEKGDDGHPDTVIDEFGNRNYDLDEEGKPITGFTGVAPLAQVVGMKVFTDYSSAANEDSILYAVSDAATLGVDVVNMSLGSPSGFSEQGFDDPPLQEAYDRLSALGINVIVAAGNSYSAGYGGHYGTNLTSNPDSGNVAHPGSLYSTMTVASINGVRTKYLAATDNAGNSLGIAYFTESAKTNGKRNEFITSMISAINGDNICGGEDQNGNPIGIDYSAEYYDASTNTYKIPYVVIPGIGESANYTSSVQGKIAIINRGRTTFTEKLVIAKKSKQALGAIVANHVAGIISMQTEQEVNEYFDFPAASITMDAAASIKSVTEGYIIISEDFGGGPFMSEFSSWGPLPSLELKPEITGHGGEIYSATPGGTYERLSGTSMATPNIAGVTLIARQHLLAVTTATEDPYSIKDANGKIDANKLENRIYQLMMSTAMSPLNQDGNYYSPRKVGAGVADVESIVKSGAYLTVHDENGVEKDRTKLELFDDPSRTGVYEMTTTLNNISNKDLKFTPAYDVFTETVSTDGRSVAERAYPLVGIPQWTVNTTATQGSFANNVITVKAKQAVEVTLKITLTAADKQYLEENFENGMYVEGFIRFIATDKTDSEFFYRDLSAPFLAFYGDWTDAPMFDYSIFETDPDDKNENMDEDEKRYAQNRPLKPYAKIIQGGTPFVLSLGEFVFSAPKSLESQIPYAEGAKSALSFNETTMFELYYASGFLRGAKYSTYQIYDTITGDVLYSGEHFNARKSGALTGAGGVKLELNPKDIGCKGGGSYRFEMQCYLDYNYKEGELPSTPTKKPKGDGTASNEWGFDFSIDTDAPILQNAEIRFERNNATKSYDKFIDFYVRDDFYMQAMGFNLYDASTATFKNYYEDGMRPVNGSKNSVNKLTYNITNNWDSIKNNERDGKWPAEITLYDYSLNTTYYEIDLKQLAINSAQIDFVDIGTYSTFRSGSDSLKVLTGFGDRYNLNDTLSNGSLRYYDDEGNLKTISDLVIKPNQKVELANALYLQPNGAWFDDLEWTSSDYGVVDINTKTGEIVGVSGGNATITIQSKANNSIKKTLNIKVVTQSEMTDFKIPASPESATTLSSVTIDERLPYIDEYGTITGKILKPGESYEVVFNLNPWFNNARIQSVTWSAGSAAVSPITITPITVVNVDETLTQVRALITAKEGTYDANGNYISNRYGYFSLRCTVKYKHAKSETVGNEIEHTLNGTMNGFVYPEFEIDNTKLVAYHGTRSDVVIPHSNIPGQIIELTTIGAGAFRSLNHVTSVVIPEGITEIGSSAFAYMQNLVSVTMPSTMKTIGSWSFAAYNDPQLGVTTSLQVVDNTTYPMKEVGSIGSAAFKDQISLASNTYYINDKEYGVKESIDSKFSFEMFREIGSFSFFNCQYLTDVDLTNARIIGKLAFAMASINAGIYSTSPDTPNILPPNYIFGEHTTLGEASFMASGITSTTLPMKRIPASAFEFSMIMLEITFTANDLVIEESAFAKACIADLGIGTINVIFKGSVDTIGKHAFSEISTLTNIVFENGVRRIEDYAFDGSTSLKTFTLAKGLEYLGESVFRGTGLTTINVATDFESNNLDLRSAFAETAAYEIRYNGNATGGNSKVAVENNLLLTADKTEIIFSAPGRSTFTLPDSVVQIRPYAFAATRLTSITASANSNLTIIGKGAFMNSHITSFTAPKVTQIPDYAFYGASKLTTINVGSVNSVGAHAFFGTAITTLPASFNTLGEFGVAAFANSKLTAITIPTAMTTIPADAFNGCTDLANVTFHSGITTIGDRAFANTKVSALEGEAVANITTIGDFAFAGCSNLSKIELPSLTKVGYGTFGVNVEEIITMEVLSVDYEQGIHENVTEDTVILYAGTPALVSVSIPNAIIIGNYGFHGQTKLNTVSLPNTTDILGYAFANSGLTTISFPAVKNIGSFAFYNAPLSGNEGKLAISEKVQTIGEGAFAGNKIVEFDVSAQNTLFFDVDGVLYRHIKPYSPTTETTAGYELVQYPDGNQDKFTYTVIEGTIRIKDFAFHNVSTLESVTLPKTLTHIGHGAFYKAENLTTYTFLSFSAPVLESWYGYFEWNRDAYDVYWMYLNVFYDNFTPAEFDENQKPTGNWLFNTVTNATSMDTFSGYNREFDSRGLENGGSRSSLDYGLTMVSPSNGIGYDTFIYTTYFSTRQAGAEAANTETQRIIATINGLPEFSQYTYATIQLVESTRLSYNQLSDGQKAHVTNISKLVEAEAFIAQGEFRMITIKFMIGRIEYTNSSIIIGARVEAPTAPTFNYGTFKFWTLNGAEFDFDTYINEEISLVAEFEHDGTTFTVSFADCDYESYEAYAGFAIEIPEEPTKKGYTFVRWEIDGIDDFDSALTNNVTIRAVWQKDGCGCGSISVSSFAFGATLICLIALGAVVMLKKRQPVVG